MGMHELTGSGHLIHALHYNNTNPASPEILLYQGLTLLPLSPAPSHPMNLDVQVNLPCGEF